jgi:hypothetical protein
MDAQNRCPPMSNNIALMPTQNPWAWVWAPNVGLCFTLHLRRSMTTLHEFGRCVGTRAFGHFLLGAHNFMVTALGSRVKGPLHMATNHQQSEQPCGREGEREGLWMLIRQSLSHGSNLVCTKVSRLLSDSWDSTCKCKSVIRPLIHTPQCTIMM